MPGSFGGGHLPSGAENCLTFVDVDIPGANHLLNLQAPEQIGAAIAAFREG